MGFHRFFHHFKANAGTGSSNRPWLISPHILSMDRKQLPFNTIGSSITLLLIQWILTVVRRRGVQYLCAGLWLQVMGSAPALCWEIQESTLPVQLCYESTTDSST